jgi:toxin CcdB
MAQFDVHRLANQPGLVVDCQADLLDYIDSRFVVPLVPPGEVGRLTRRLNPVFEIEGAEYALLTQAATAIRKTDLGRAVASLSSRDHEIIDALDVLLTGV